MKKLELGVAYHGNRILKHVQDDMLDILKHNANLFVHMYTHNDMLRNKNLMSDISPKSVEKSDDLIEGNNAFYDFTVSFFKENQVNGDNVLISPLSVLCALSMTANGAENDTLKEMEETL